MVGDVKRAVTWMKRNAGPYGVEREKVVLAGSSASAHIALLAAYSAGDADFTPAELRDSDCSVAGVVSYYGPVDLQAMYSHLLKTMGTSEPDPKRGNRRSAKLGGAIAKLLLGGQSIPSVTLPQLFTNLLGATPLDDPGAAAWPTQINHVPDRVPADLAVPGRL